MTRSDLALAALATAAVPGMQPVSVVGVRPGHPRARFQTALVQDVTGRRWVVRCPRGPAAGAELERNDALVRMLGRHLPFTVPAAVGYASAGADGRAGVYPYVEGKALALRHLPPGPGLAAAVGRAVAAIHNTARELFEEAGVPAFDAAGYRARRLAELDHAAETGQVPNGLLARWEQALEAAPLWQFATTPTHGSLDGSDLLVAFTDDDSATGRVVAVTGWERAQVADPADDFASLVEQAHPSAVDAVLESYALARSQRPDPHLLTRARLASEMQLIAGLAQAVAADDEELVRARADRLRRLDRLTSMDDLLPRTVVTTVPTAAQQPRGGPSVDGGPAAVPEVEAPDRPGAEEAAASGPDADVVRDEPVGAGDADPTQRLARPGTPPHDAAGTPPDDTAGRATGTDQPHG